MSARILKCTAAEYHADALSPVPTLNRGVALEMVKRRSAFHGHRIHPRLGAMPDTLDALLDEDEDEGDTAAEPDTKKKGKALDTGKVLHALLLEPGEDPREEIRGEDGMPITGFRTKFAKAAKAAAEARGKVPLKTFQMAPFDHAAAMFRASLLSLGIDLEQMEREVAIEWEDEGVLCRSRLDTIAHYPRDHRLVIYDLKFMKDGSPDTLLNSSYKFGYDIEAHTHISALETLRPEFAGRVEWCPVACELGTWLCMDHHFGGTMRELGRKRWERAREMWRASMRSGEWPGYTRTRLEAKSFWLMEAGAEL